jgi:hypothetical protein
MKQISKIYHFLGGVYFAIILITLVTVFVIVGTLLESATDSHRYAALFTYSNPVFFILLWGFFINILFSALRRWPFKMKHVPFLITHWGLLMILAGVMIKSRYGVQGTMSLMEGSTSNEIFLPDSYVLRVDKKISQDPLKIQTFYHDVPTQFNSHIDGINLAVAEYSPHSYERLETWLKGDHGYISGLSRFPVQQWNEESSQSEIVPSTSVKVLHPDSPPWDIFAVRTSEIEQSAKKLFVQGTELIITDSATKEQIYRGLLETALNDPIVLPENKIVLNLNFEYSPITGIQNPELFANSFSQNRQEWVRLPLQGPGPLLQASSTPYLGASSYTIELLKKPVLSFFQDLHHDTFLFAFGPQGQVHSEVFKNDGLRSYIAYEKGFGGYAIQTHIPKEVLIEKKASKDNKTIDDLKVALKSVDTKSLVPPLLLLYKACESTGADFSTVTADFMNNWNNNRGWLYSPETHSDTVLDNVCAHIDWSHVAPQDKKACYWLHTFFLNFDPLLLKGENFIDLLMQKQWPLISSLESNADPASQLTAFTHQIFSIADQLPEIDEEHFNTPLIQHRLLSAYFRAYSLHLHNLMTSAPMSESTEGIYLETPLSWRQLNAPASKKLENNLPKITLKLKKDSQNEWVTLTYDRFGQGLKKPILNGGYMIRFQSKFITIPYSLRLRQARQINYANSAQPYSYESDLIITNLQDQKQEEKTISMNNVHETWEGYRFYLANISPDESSAKRIQLIVNYDPAKYWLTYPGAVILSMGIFLLFWKKMKK